MQSGITFPSGFIARLGKSTGKAILSPKEHNVPKNHFLNPSRLPSSPVCGMQAIHLGVIKGVSAIVGVCQLKDLTAAGEEPGVSQAQIFKVQPCHLANA